MQVRNRLSIAVMTLALAAAGYFALSTSSQKKIVVAVDAPLMSMRVFDPSDMDAARLYFEENPDSRMQLREMFYDYDPQNSAPRFQAAMDDGVELFVTTQPSSTLTASADLFNRSNALIINASATSPTMTGKDDFMIRIIADARLEQEAIADYVNTLDGRRLLVLQDTANAAYTAPGFEFFIKRLGQKAQWDVTLEQFPFQNFRPDSFTQLMAAPFDALYLLAGDFQANMGNLAQLFYHYHPQAPIILTPWARSNAILESAGPAIHNIVLISSHPAKAQDPAIAAYLNRFKQRYGYQPMAMALTVRQALELLEQALAAGHTEPQAIKQYLISQGTLKTSLGEIELDQFGDRTQPLYPINRLDLELKNP